MKGSYQLNSFTENKNSEVIRLKAQVELFFEKEFETYLKFGLTDGMNIIECGSGPGFLLKNIKKEFPGCKATALEIDPFLLEILEENSFENNNRIFDVRHASIYNTGFPDNTFDFAIARLVVEHLHDPLTALREMHRIIKPGGKVVIVSNDFAYHLITFPIIPELDEMYKAYCRSRFSEGGNPLAGRQIPGFLRKTGFSGIKHEVINVHSELRGDKALLQAENVNISKSLVSEGYLSREILDQLAASWYNMLNDPDHAIYRQLFMTGGEKADLGIRSSNIISELSTGSNINKDLFKKLTGTYNEITLGDLLKNHVKRIMNDDNLSLDNETRLCDVDIDSIGAAELSSIIKSGFNKDVSISDILQKYCINDITRIILDSREKMSKSSALEVSVPTAMEKDETSGISEIQQQFWILGRMFPRGVAYNIPSVLKISGTVNIEALEYAINRIIERHEILRSCYYEKDEKVFQKVGNYNKFRIEIVASEGKLADRETVEQILNEVHKPFNLSEWPLFRIKLFTGGEESILSIVFHHIIVDLHSRDIFSDELGFFYNSFLSRQDSNLPKASGKYADYAKWQKEWLASGEASAKMLEWKDEIAGFTSALQLPSDFPKPKVENLEGRRNYFHFDKFTSDKISRFAVQRSVNPFTVLLAAYSILLFRLTGQQKFTIGVPLTNRRKAEFADTFGCFVNILPVMFDFSGDVSSDEVVHMVRQSLLRAHRKQEIPFLRLNKMIQSGGRNSLFQTGFTMEHPMIPDLNGVKIQSVEIDKAGAQLDLFLTLWETVNDFRGYLEYSTSLFTDETAKRVTGLYRTIVNSMLDGPEMHVSEINILTSEEAEMIISWNNTDHKFSEDTCIHKVFEQQARKTPSHPALMFGDSILSYSALDESINRLANHLTDSGVRVEDIVCVSMERSPELLIAIYAILKSGAAYLPVDPAYPTERIRLILDDARPVLVLTNRHSDSNIPDHFRKVYLDNILVSPLSDKTNAPSVEVKSGNLAYLMYTSGSTGKPKGVMIEHRSVINKLEWMQYKHPLDENDTILFKTPVTFDVSGWELFWWIFSGAKLAILPVNGEKDPGTIIEYIESKKVTAVIFVPSMFSAFADYVKANHSTDRLNTLKWIIQIGETLSPSLVNFFNELRTSDFDPSMINTYGPTEATIAVSWYNCPKEKNVGKIFIGKPIHNTKLLVLNNNNRIQPVGVPGELVITGVNLARGYLNRPELNSEKFISFELPDGCVLRGYKTGDLVKWQPDGNLDFIGRIDSQVKLRGHRIELGEIETRLNEFPGTNNSAVIIREAGSGEKLIIGYVTLKEKGSYSANEIKNFLSGVLPEYMIPAQIVILDEMPLNNSGKIDRKSLPEPDLASNVEMVAPDSFYEKKLLEIFQDILKVENIGITHNFFDIGGNSLLSIRIVNEIKERLNFQVDPIRIMEFPDIRRLSRYIAELNSPVKQAEPIVDRQSRLQDFSKLQERRRSN